RGKNDEDCIIAMGGITDTRFQTALVRQAQQAGKLRAAFHPPSHWIDNTPVHLSARLRAFRRDGTLPDYPLGSDFTDVEQRIVKALGWLKANTATPWKKIGTV
ncbi:hypothetical protein ABEH87_21735, partial [Erwinia sp. Eh17-17]|uniref:hypothetical protein n=1 Tax=Erwinia sp. Eh17-17 TaxID=3080330 RepID=UPI0032083049